jgi:hypothetical protein
LSLHVSANTVRPHSGKLHILEGTQAFTYTLVTLSSKNVLILLCIICTSFYTPSGVQFSFVTVPDTVHMYRDQQIWRIQVSAPTFGNCCSRFHTVGLVKPRRTSIDWR